MNKVDVPAQEDSEEECGRSGDIATSLTRLENEEDESIAEFV